MNNSYTLTIHLDDGTELTRSSVHPHRVDEVCRSIITEGFSIGGVPGSGDIFSATYFPAHRIVSVVVS